MVEMVFQELLVVVEVVQEQLVLCQQDLVILQEEMVETDQPLQ
jgi:hypothetical protein